MEDSFRSGVGRGHIGSGGFARLEAIESLDVVDQSNDVAAEHQEQPDDTQNTEGVEGDEDICVDVLRSARATKVCKRTTYMRGEEALLVVGLNTIVMRKTKRYRGTLTRCTSTES
jgi:hypothetical protein